MDYTISDRGFAYPTPIITDYGTELSVSDSSVATRDCLWLRLKGEGTLHTNDGDMSAHLTFEQAETLVEQIQWLIQRRRDLAAPTNDQN